MEDHRLMMIRYLGLIALCLAAPTHAAEAPQPPPQQDQAAAVVQNFIAEKTAMEGSAAALLRSEQHLDEIARALVQQYGADLAKWEQERKGYEARLQTAMEWLKAAQAAQAKPNP